MFLAISMGLLSASAPGAIPPAYIEPTAGGILLQIVLGGTAGVLVLGRLFWHNITSVFRHSRKEPANKSADDPPQSR